MRTDYHHFSWAFDAANLGLDIPAGSAAEVVHLRARLIPNSLQRTIDECGGCLQLPGFAGDVPFADIAGEEPHIAAQLAFEFKLGRVQRLERAHRSTAGRPEHPPPRAEQEESIHNNSIQD